MIIAKITECTQTVLECGVLSAKEIKIKMVKKIYLDFETTNIDPTKADILEACFLFVDDRKIIKKFSSKIIIDKYYKDMTLLEIDTLKFNKINNEEEFERHNKSASSWVKFILSVLKYYENWQDIDNNDKKIKIPLTGWNNAGFDNIIFQKHINCKLSKYFDYHTRDIMHSFRILKEKLMIVGGLSLSKLHNDILGDSTLQFHTAIDDCIAVKELDEWLEDSLIIKLK